MPPMALAAYLSTSPRESWSWTARGYLPKIKGGLTRRRRSYSRRTRTRALCSLMSPRAGAGDTTRRPYRAPEARADKETSIMTTPSRPDPLPMVLVVLTVTTGLVDAVSVLGLGRVFTANMTGNVVFLGFAAAGGPGFSVARAGGSLAGVIVCALPGGRPGVAMARVARRRWLLRLPVGGA